MGEVYKGRDTRLDRTVAIKVLPEALAADPQFRERFDREARTISRLAHPNICTLFDVGEEAGTAFLVMELMEGETLESRCVRAKGSGLQLDEAMRIAIQMGVSSRDGRSPGDGPRLARRPGAVHVSAPVARSTERRRGKTDAVTAQPDLWLLGLPVVPPLA